MGGLSVIRPELADEIVKRISEGETLRGICRDAHMPNWSSVYDWIHGNEDFAQRIARARELGADAIAEDIFSIIDEEPPTTATQFGEKVDAGYVAWQKNRAEQRLKLLAKWSPKKYGEKTDVNMNVTNSLGEALAALSK